MRKAPIGGKNAVRADGADVRIRISPVMLVMAVFYVAVGMAYELSCALTAVVLHEFAHASAAKRLGYALNEIKLMPYGAALGGCDDIRPAHEAAIAAAGPAFNLAVALIFAALWWLLPASYMFTSTFCGYNVYIAAFNLLPVYPMDGGRLLLSALSVRHGRSAAYRATRIVSAVFGTAALAAFCVSAAFGINISALAVGIFMVASAFLPSDRARYYALFALASRGKRFARPVAVRRYAVSDSAKLYELCRVLDPDRYTEFTVLCDGGAKHMTEDELIGYVKAVGYERTVGSMPKIRGRENREST